MQSLRMMASGIGLDVGIMNIAPHSQKSSINVGTAGEDRTLEAVFMLGTAKPHYGPPNRKFPAPHNGSQK
jgi:hypothetical protein